MFVGSGQERVRVVIIVFIKQKGRPKPPTNNPRVEQPQLHEVCYCYLAVVDVCMGPECGHQFVDGWAAVIRPLLGNRVHSNARRMLGDKLTITNAGFFTPVFAKIMVFSAEPDTSLSSGLV